MGTPLFLFGTNTAAGTIATANTLVTSTGAVAIFKTSLIGTATGYGTLWSQGNAGAWAAGGSLPAFNGHGWLWDVTTLEGNVLAGGTFAFAIKLGASLSGMTVDLYARVAKVNGGVYTQIGGNFLKSGLTPLALALDTISVTLPATSFATGDKLYFQVDANVTANTTGSGTTTLGYDMGNSSSLGYTSGPYLLTQGYSSGGGGGGGTVGGMALVASGTGVASFDSFRAAMYPDPALSLANMSRVGSSFFGWNSILPSVAATLGMFVSTDGVNFLDMTQLNGGTVPGLTNTPDPSVDIFNVDTSANYTTMAGGSGTQATWWYDRPNSRLQATGGSLGLFLYGPISTADIDCMTDMDRADTGGLSFRVEDSNNFYALVVADASATVSTPNRATLYKYGGYRDLILKDKPLAYYRLDEASGTTATDSTGGGHNGTITGGVTLSQTGLIPNDADRAMLFDGSSGYINVSPSGFFTGGADMSAEAWINTSSFAQDGGAVNRRALICNQDGNNAFQFVSTDAADGYCFAVNDAGTAYKSSKTALSLNTTYHLVGTYTAASHTCNLYVNGVLASTADTSAAFLLGTTGFNIGRRADSKGYYPGTLDEVAIYNYALTQTQVTNHYTAGTSAVQVAQATIAFTRGTFHRLRVTMLGGIITATFDGAALLTYTDNAPLGAGQVGLVAYCGSSAPGWAIRTFTGATYYGSASTPMARFYQFWAQPQGTLLSGSPAGDVVSSTFVYTKQSLATTDSTVSPQVLDMTIAVFDPNIGPGIILPSGADYRYTFIDKNLADLGKQSNYDNVTINETKHLIFKKRIMIPSPWILYSTAAGVALAVDLEVDTNLVVEVANDQYRNRQVLLGVLADIPFTTTITGNGSASTFPLPYPIKSGTVPTIILNGIPQATAPKGATGSQWYYDVQRWPPGPPGTIAQDPATGPLQGTDTMTVAGIGTFITNLVIDNVAAQQALAAIEGGTGIVEAVEDVSARNMDIASATTYANQLLSRYCVTGRTLTFMTYRNGLDVGQQLAVFLPEMGIWNGQFLVTEVTIGVQTTAPNTVQYNYLVVASEIAYAGSWQKLLASGLLT